MSINHCEKQAPPDGMIGPRLSAAGRMLRNRFNAVAGSEGLFSGQHHILINLKKNGGMTVSQLAERLDITAATASVSVKRMEKSGFVEKRPDAQDARITRLYLTEKGIAATENIREKMEAQESIITDGFTHEEVMTLSALLDRVFLNLTREDDCHD